MSSTLGCVRFYFSETPLSLAVARSTVRHNQLPGPASCGRQDKMPQPASEVTGVYSLMVLEARSPESTHGRAVPPKGQGRVLPASRGSQWLVGSADPRPCEGGRAEAWEAQHGPPGTLLGRALRSRSTVNRTGKGRSRPACPAPSDTRSSQWKRRGWRRAPLHLSRSQMWAADAPLPTRSPCVLGEAACQGPRGCPPGPRPPAQVSPQDPALPRGRPPASPRKPLSLALGLW